MTIIIDDFVAPPCLESIHILQEDEHFLLINKPSGLLSLSGKNPLNKDSVHFRLRQSFPTASLVHRLDLGTSGIMLVALNKEANVNLSKQFQMREVTKTYISVLDGHFTSNKGQINAPIAKDRQLFPRLKVCDASGKAAKTNYQVLERLNEPATTRVRYEPQTGRTHQLRIHSQYIGHPILGCDLYGNVRTFEAATRMLLHAETLTFLHPFSGQQINAFCPCPF